MNIDIDLTDVVLETERLILREWNENDLDDLYENACIEEFAKIAGWKAHSSKEESWQVLQKFINDKNAFAIVYKGNYKVVGNIILENCLELDQSFDDLKGIHLRFVLNEKYWGQSIMNEAMQCVINYCFHELQHDFIASGYFVENDMQKSFLYKLGFEDYKRIQYHTNYDENKKMELTLMYNPFRK